MQVEVALLVLMDDGRLSERGHRLGVPTCELRRVIGKKPTDEGVGEIVEVV